ncbi:MAG: CbiX/SirB N-terminal domain-containing protein, partial [Bacilli bacterium]
GSPAGRNEQLKAVVANSITLGQNESTKKTALLFVGRGSRYAVTPEDIAWYVEGITQQFPENDVYTSFLAVLSPSYEEQIQRLVLSGYNHVVVVPFILFTGRLGQRLKRVQHEWREELQFTYTPYLGHNKKVVEVFADSLKRLLDKDEKFQ